MGQNSFKNKCDEKTLKSGKFSWVEIPNNYINPFYLNLDTLGLTAATIISTNIL